MRDPLLACRIGIVLALLLLGCNALGQGCGQGIDSENVPCYVDPQTGQVTDTDSSSCSPDASGSSSYYCSEGQGYCSETGNIFYTANLTYDPEDCGPPPTCCNGGVVCGEREFCVDDCGCHYASPIIVDTTGKGFHLTSSGDGVMFDIAGDGHPIKMAWTAADSGNAFLALDRNHNGRIDSGKEIFGNFTAQPDSDRPNGYLALAEFDKPQNGGNGDGIIDSRDSVYSKLLLWIDENHDGISQPNELHTLPELGVFSINLRYTDDHHDDAYGNWFHYEAALNPSPLDGVSKDGRWTYDVFFEVAQPGDAPTAQSGTRPPERRNQWHLPLVEASFQGGVLYEGPELAFLPSRKTNCHPKPDRDHLGGQ